MEEATGIEQQGVEDVEVGGDQDTGIGIQQPGLSAEEPEPRTQSSEQMSQDSALSTNAELEQLRAELEEAKARHLGSYRRALLAENTGKIVPELVTGATVEELEQSVEVARKAFEAARATALAEISAQRVPAGNPVRQGPNVESMSPMEKIAHGLKRE